MYGICLVLSDGYIDADFVAIESDSQETYDDVIPCGKTI